MTEQRTITDLANAIIEDLDKSYELVYVDYRDELSDEQAAMIVRGDTDKFYESFDEWEADSRWNSCKYIIDEQVKSVISQWEDDGETLDDELAEDFNGSEEFDRVRFEIEERDTSDLVRQLLCNSSRVLLRINVIDEDNCYSFEEVSAGRVISDLNRANQRGSYGFNADPETIETIDYVLRECSPEYSVLMGYWIVGVDLSDIYNLPNDPDAEIEVVNPYLYLGNPFTGSGFISERPLKGVVHIRRDELRTDKDAFGYTVDEIFGGLSASSFECEIRKESHGAQDSSLT